MKKFGRKAQGFVKSFTDFLHAYSGIVELLRGAGQVYSEVAYETLSIFFIVSTRTPAPCQIALLNDRGRREQKRQRYEDGYSSYRPTKIDSTARRMDQHL
jgi:hypothetical protein